MNIRKSYKSLVNWGYRNLIIKIYDKTNITEDIITLFENFHIEISKRRTRSHNTWLIQYEAIKNEKGYIVLGYYNENIVSAVLIVCSQTESYYGVAVNDRHLMAQKLPIGHTLLLESIFYSKRTGLKKFHLGNVSNTDDEKLNYISKYKRGFNSTINTKIVHIINL
jgi:hypothetical protein